MVIAEPRSPPKEVRDSGVYFWAFLRFVAKWEPRPHQLAWVTALQALADGRLRHPKQEQCDLCARVEQKWIDLSGYPYLSGFRVGCKSCKTTNKLLIPAWPGSGKTNTLIQWMAWRIGQQTSKGFTPQSGLICYSDDVASIRSVALRDMVEFSPEYKLVFPLAVPLKTKGWGQREWFLARADLSKKDPTLRASGFGGTILSYRFPTAILIDDPHNPDEVVHPGARDRDWRIYELAIKTRGAQDSTPMVIVMNRFADDDLAGRVETVEKDWLILHTPAVVDGESAWPPEVVDGEPMGISTSKLEELKETNYLTYVTQYLVEPPSAEGGGLIRWFKRGKKPSPDEILRIIQFWDTATTAKTNNDFSAKTELWVLKNGPVYLADVLNVRITPGELMDRMVAEEVKAKALCKRVEVYIEHTSASPVFVESLWRNSGLRVRPHSIPTAITSASHGKVGGHVRLADLTARSSAVVKLVEEGQVVIPFDEGFIPWLRPFETQVLGYTGPGSSSKDDMLASFVGALEVAFPGRYGKIRPFSFKIGRW